MTKKTFEKCFFPDSDGKMSDVFNTYTAGTPEFLQLSDAVDKMYNLFNGVSEFIIWDNKFKNENVDFTSKLKEEFNFYKDGHRFDYGNV